jgi:membrane protease YdiL (CAAX protease family)
MSKQQKNYNDREILDYPLLRWLYKIGSLIQTINTMLSRNPLYDSKYRMVVARTLSICYFIVAVATYASFLELNSRYSRQSTGDWDLILFLCSMVVGLFLSVVHKDIYWGTMFRRKNDFADERQKLVRLKVYSVSFKILAACVLLVAFHAPLYLNAHIEQLRQADGIYIPYLSIVWLIVALPSAVASLRKDA